MLHQPDSQQVTPKDEEVDIRQEPLVVEKDSKIPVGPRLMKMADYFTNEGGPGANDATGYPGTDE